MNNDYRRFCPRYRSKYVALQEKKSVKHNGKWPEGRRSSNLRYFYTSFLFSYHSQLQCVAKKCEFLNYNVFIRFICIKIHGEFEKNKHKQDKKNLRL